jgi:hypothetical protein
MVTEWSEWSDAEAATNWDTEIVRLSNHTYYQAYGWGEFKRRQHWTPRRATILVDGAVTAMVQCLVREIRVARTVLAWVPGGPAGHHALPALGAALRRRYRGWLLWVRINGAFEASPGCGDGLVEAGWRRADVRVGHPFTFQLDLREDAAQRRAALSQNWRHNLARGERRGGRVVTCGKDDSLEGAYCVYRGTAERNGLPQPFALPDLVALRGIFGPAFTLAVAVNESGDPIGMRGFMRLGARADDFVSGLSADGRRRYANYPLTWRLLELATEQGITTYDLGGSDAVAAAGVHAFKRGLGGRGVELVGEWQWHNSRCLDWAVSRMIMRRVGRGVPV